MLNIYIKHIFAENRTHNHIGVCMALKPYITHKICQSYVISLSSFERTYWVAVFVNQSTNYIYLLFSDYEMQFQCIHTCIKYKVILHVILAMKWHPQTIKKPSPVSLISPLFYFAPSYVKLLSLKKRIKDYKLTLRWQTFSFFVCNEFPKITQ